MIQLPPRPSVGQGAIVANVKNFELFAEVAKLYDLSPAPCNFYCFTDYKDLGLVVIQFLKLGPRNFCNLSGENFF